MPDTVFYFFIYLLHWVLLQHVGPGIEPGLSALGAHGLSYWTTREVPARPILKKRWADIFCKGQYNKYFQLCRLHTACVAMTLLNGHVCVPVKFYSKH